MTDFVDQDLSGSRFENVRLKGAHFDIADLSGTRFKNVDLSGALIRGALLINAELDGDISNLVVNGVDVAPLVEAELDRRYPDRAKMRPETAEGYREAWAILERLWAGTVARARTFDESHLHERVDGEWSFIETLRHLVFATDAWVKRAFLGEPKPWHPLGLPHDEMEDIEGVPRDHHARPSLDEILAVRADRMGTVRRVFDQLTDETLAGMTDPVMEPGYPGSESFKVRRCLAAIVSEEWEHRLFAERDLDVLQSRSS